MSATLVGESGSDLGVAREIDEEDGRFTTPRHKDLLEFGDFGLLGANTSFTGFLLFLGEKMGIVLDPAAVSKLR